MKNSEYETGFKEISILFKEKISKLQKHSSICYYISSIVF